MQTASAVHENKLGMTARNAAVCTTTSGTKYLSMTNVGRVELGRSSGEFDVSWVMCGPICCNMQYKFTNKNVNSITV